MSSATAPGSIDFELLELAKAELARAGYETKPIEVDSNEMLVAEDRDNVIVLGALISAEAALHLEPAMTEALSTQFAASKSTPKRWDGYVVILTSVSAASELGEPLYAMAYNLARVRRIIRLNVPATNAGVRRALAPLLPLSMTTSVLPPSNPSIELERRLVAQGVPEEAVARALAEFRSQSAASQLTDVPGDWALDVPSEED